MNNSTQDAEMVPIKPISHDGIMLHETKLTKPSRPIIIFCFPKQQWNHITINSGKHTLTSGDHEVNPSLSK